MASSFSTGALLCEVARLLTQFRRLCVFCCAGITVTQGTVLNG
jgi:hypothetical protein